MPRQDAVLCICCHRWITRHRERQHRSRLQTPYSAPSKKVSSKLAVITSISSDDSSSPRSSDRHEDEENGHFGDINSLHDEDVQIDAEHILHSWILMQREAATSSGSDEENEGADEDDEMRDQNDFYPEWDDFEMFPEGVPVSALLSEDYKREAAAVGKY